MTARDRLLQAISLTVIVTAMLGTTAGYGLHFRTQGYRRNVEARLSDFFQLPTEVGRVEPHTLHSRVFRDVRIWLPGRRDRIFFCPTAVWRQAGRGPVPDLYLELNGGTLAIGSEQWLPEDYRRVLRSAFTRNLADLNMRLVEFHGMDLVWPRRDGRLTAENVSGRIVFDDHHRGEATLVSQSLNGYKVVDPVHIHALVRPTEEDFLPEVRLTFPRLPLASLNLDRLLGKPVRSGQFGGTITYHQRGLAEDVRLSGQAEGLELRELTAGAAFGPTEGRISLRIDDARIEDSPPRLTHIRFGARIEGLDLGPLARRAGYPEISGRAGIVVHQAHVEGRRLREFSAGGRIEGVPVEGLTRRLGQGIIRGNLSVRLNALRIIDDRIASLDADVEVVPPRGRPGTIDREFLLGTIRGMIGLQVPEQMLPPRIEYARIGAKLLINEGRLRLFGLVGPGRTAIIVLRLLGQDVPIPAPTDTFSIQSVLDRIQSRARDVDLETLKTWWRSPPPATAPATQGPLTTVPSGPTTGPHN